MSDVPLDVQQGGPPGQCFGEDRAGVALHTMLHLSAVVAFSLTRAREQRQYGVRELNSRAGFPATEAAHPHATAGRSGTAHFR